MSDDDLVPGPDAEEQDMPVDDEAPLVEPVGGVGDRPEADVLEQSMVVRTAKDVRPPTRRDDVPEADAWEQSIEAPLDDDDRS
jgi:hypothetical protein